MIEDISTHALREEGDVGVDLLGEGGTISTHALREEGDSFQALRLKEGEKISTHALREEGD